MMHSTSHRVTDAERAASVAEPTRGTGTEGSALLVATNITAGYATGRRAPRILHDVSIAVHAGGTIAIAGESGSGKSTLAKVLIGQLPTVAGRVTLEGAEVTPARSRPMKVRRRQIQLIPQDPYGSLDPRMTVGRAIAEAIDPSRPSFSRHAQRVEELLEMVALDNSAADRLPHEFSGGQRQRIVIARALAVNPKVLVADEVTAALDSSVQAEILNLLRSLQHELRIGIAFITHDLALARYLCDEVAVLYQGRLMEAGEVSILEQPAHPYTKLLVDSVPDREGSILTRPGAAASDLGSDGIAGGCVFRPRCPIGVRTHPERTECVSVIPQPESRHLEGEQATTTLAPHPVACHFPLTPGAEPLTGTDQGPASRPTSAPTTATQGGPRV